MNLTKLFNLNYIKENLKKSKGIIILSTIILPILTIILRLNILKEETILSEWHLLVLNIIGMFIIPLVLSISLFGYIYKRKSVDFINSMPLTRKTIFFSNTIIGIILILLIQILTFVGLLICNYFTPKSYAFPEMIYNVFIYMTISYIFIFTATNIAMTLSGTIMTQLVLTALILLFVPFYNIYFTMLCEETSNYDAIINNVRIDSSVNNNDFSSDYTMPMNMINALDSKTFITTNSMIKMSILSIAYIIIGLYLFEKRKMENTEESFASTKAHLFVKLLTILPFVTIVSPIENSALILIFIAMAVIYYFVYDYIVKKKVKFKLSLLYFIITIIPAYMLFSCILENKEYKSEPLEINLENTSAIEITSVRNKLGVTLKDKEIIDQILKFIVKTENYHPERQSEYNKTLMEKGDFENYTLNDEFVYLESDQIEDIEINGFTIKIIHKNSKETQVSRRTLKEEDLNELIELLINNEEYVENAKRIYEKNSIIYKDEKRYIVEKENKLGLKSDISNYIFKDFKTELKNQLCNENTPETDICNAYYENNKICTYIVLMQDETINNKVYKILNEEFATKMEKTLEKCRENKLNNNHRFEIYIEYEKGNEAVNTQEIDSSMEIINNLYIESDYRHIDVNMNLGKSNYENFIKTILEESQKEFNINEPYYARIRVGILEENGYKYMLLYTNNKEFKKEIKNYRTN